MRRTISVSLPLLLVAASGFCADFEGTFEMKVTMTGPMGGGGGTMKIAIGKPGVRTEMSMSMGEMGAMKIVTLMKTDNPDVLYQLNEPDKSYSEMSLAKMRAMMGQNQPEGTATVKKLGEETVLGYKTQHVMVTQNGADIEMWTTKDLGEYSTFQKLQAGKGPGGGDAMIKALKDAGADGMPVKAITPVPGGGKVTMEVTKADKKSLPASTFEIPAGYSKSSGGMGGMMGGTSGPQADDAHARMEEAQKQLNERMKNMTPEQREMMEKMMKQRGMQGQGTGQ